MKIRRFNESLDKIDTDYIDECFVEFIDMDLKFERDVEVYNMSIPMYVEKDEVNNISNFTTMLEKAYDNSQQIQECIEKVKMKYSDIEYSISLYRDKRSTYIDVCFIIDERTQRYEEEDLFDDFFTDVN